MSKELPPTAAPAPAGGNKGLAIGSLVLGILSLCASLGWWCGGPISVIGLILGFLGIKSTGKGMAVAGIILSGIGLLLTIILVVLRLVMGPAIQNVYDQILNQIQP